MMSGEQLIFIVAVVYASLLVGVLMKFRMNGVNGAALWFTPFVPFLVFLIPIFIVSVMETTRFKKEFGKSNAFQKLNVARVAFVISVKAFPMIVGVVAHIILLVKAKRKPKIVDEAMPLFREIYQAAF